MRITCPYTGEEITIVRMHNLDTRLWPFVGQRGIELAIVTACVIERNELFYKFNELDLWEDIHPRDYVHWLYLEVLKVNPNLEEIVERWRKSGNQ